MLWEEARWVAALIRHEVAGLWDAGDYWLGWDFC